MMKHDLHLSSGEKVSAWLDLCDFALKLMESSIDSDRLEARLRRVRDETLAGHTNFLVNLGKATR